MGRFDARTFVGLTSSVLLALTLALTLAACTATPTPAPSSPPATANTPVPTEVPTPRNTPTAVAPQYHPDGTALSNEPYFDSVNRALLATNSSPAGKDVINALVAAGFSKAVMQLTPDKTTIGRKVDALVFSVRIGTNCLLGQFDNSQYTSSVQAALADGRCLVGATRTINW